MLTLLRVLASFAIVGVLLWLFMRASNGRLGRLISGTAKGRLGEPLAVLDRRQLTRSTGIALVRAGERHLLVGVSDQGVQLLAEGDDLAIAPDTTDPLTLEGAPGSTAIVTPRDVVNDSSLTTDQPDAWTRSGAAHGPRSPRMSFIAALREMTVRRS